MALSFEAASWGALQRSCILTRLVLVKSYGGFGITRVPVWNTATGCFRTSWTRHFVRLRVLDDFLCSIVPSFFYAAVSFLACCNVRDPQPCVHGITPPPPLLHNLSSPFKAWPAIVAGPAVPMSTTILSPRPGLSLWQVPPQFYPLLLVFLTSLHPCCLSSQYPFPPAYST